MNDREPGPIDSNTVTEEKDRFAGTCPFFHSSSYLLIASLIRLSLQLGLSIAWTGTYLSFPVLESISSFSRLNSTRLIPLLTYLFFFYSYSWTTERTWWNLSLWVSFLSLGNSEVNPPYSFDRWNKVKEKDKYSFLSHSSQFLAALSPILSSRVNSYSIL